MQTQFFAGKGFVKGETGMKLEVLGKREKGKQ